MTATWYKARILGIEVKAPRRSMEVGQELVRQWLKVRPEGLSGLLIHHRCKGLIAELRGYLKHEPGQGAHHAVPWRVWQAMPLATKEITSGNRYNTCGLKKGALSCVQKLVRRPYF